MTYYLFLKNPLYRATILALLLPFVVFAISSVSTIYLYSFSLPISYLIISSLPILGLAVKVSIHIESDKLTIHHSVFGYSFKCQAFTILQNEKVTWVQSHKNKRIHTLFIGNKSTSLTIST